MLMSLAMLMAFVASLVLPVVGVVAVVTYVRRTRQLERMDSDRSFSARILDSLDQVHLRLDAMSERLARLEQGEKLERERSAGRLPRVDSQVGDRP